MVRALPEQGAEIRRQARQDGGLRAICEDYRDALAALAHHRAGPGADVALAEEYRVLADELVAEATGRLIETRTDTEEHDG